MAAPVIAFAADRVLFGLVAVWAAASLVFLLAAFAPGDPVTAMAGDFGAAGHAEAVARALGLDRPLPVLYAEWLGRLAVGDLGVSWRSQVPVATLIAERAPVTLALMLAALILAAAAGTLLGLALSSPVRPLRWVAGLFAGIHALPSYVVAQALVFGLALGLGVFPVQGLSDPRAPVEGAARLFDLAWRLTLPVLSLALLQTAFVALLCRARVSEELARPYVRTARAKGLGPWAVKVGHALPNAALPLVTLVGWRLGSVIGGAVVVETVFALPGLGRLVVTAATARDHPVVVGVVVVACAVAIATNLLVDAVVRRLDPRVGAG
jgi:peptide/nickel transport system permease protein